MTKTTGGDMKNFLIACGVALALAGSARAEIPGVPTQSFDGTCARFRATAYVPDLVSQEPFACCDEGHDCPRFLSITPAPIPHRDLKT